MRSEQEIRAELKILEQHYQEILMDNYLATEHRKLWLRKKYHWERLISWVKWVLNEEE